MTYKQKDWQSTLKLASSILLMQFTQSILALGAILGNVVSGTLSCPHWKAPFIRLCSMSKIASVARPQKALQSCGTRPGLSCVLSPTVKEQTWALHNRCLVNNKLTRHKPSQHAVLSKIESTHPAASQEQGRNTKETVPANSLSSS